MTDDGAAGLSLSTGTGTKFSVSSTKYSTTGAEVDQVATGVGLMCLRTAALSVSSQLSLCFSSQVFCSCLLPLSLSLALSLSLFCVGAHIRAYSFIGIFRSCSNLPRDQRSVVRRVSERSLAKRLRVSTNKQLPHVKLFGSLFFLFCSIASRHSSLFFLLSFIFEKGWTKPSCLPSKRPCANSKRPPHCVPSKKPTCPKDTRRFERTRERVLNEHTGTETKTQDGQQGQWEFRHVVNMLQCSDHVECSDHVASGDLERVKVALCSPNPLV